MHRTTAYRLDIVVPRERFAAGKSGVELRQVVEHKKDKLN